MYEVYFPVNKLHPPLPPHHEALPQFPQSWVCFCVCPGQCLWVAAGRRSKVVFGGVRKEKGAGWFCILYELGAATLDTWLLMEGSKIPFVSVLLWVCSAGVPGSGDPCSQSRVVDTSGQRLSSMPPGSGHLFHHSLDNQRLLVA